MLLIITTVTAALVAGLFYGWSCSVIPGLSRIGDKEYVSAMQSINKAILNPVFFAGFIGTLFLLPICSYCHFTKPGSLRFWLLLAATVTYTVGVFGVTMFGNVPLNDKLAMFDIEYGSAEQISLARKNFEVNWNNFNLVRTIFAILTTILLIIACVQSPNSGDEG